MNAFAQTLGRALERCIATRAVSEEGAPVGFMYREQPLFEHDSGWRFFSGDEDDAYTDNAANFSICALADICRHTPDIAPLLDAAAIGAWERGADGGWMAVADWQPQD